MVAFFCSAVLAVIGVCREAPSGVVARADYDVPARWAPAKFCGRDFTPCFYAAGQSARSNRPGAIEPDWDLSIFRDSAVLYGSHSRAVQPILPDKKNRRNYAFRNTNMLKRAEYSFKDYFHGASDWRFVEEWSKPESPAFFRFSSARPAYFLPKTFPTDRTGFEKWVEEHPNFVAIGALDEFDNDTNFYVANVMNCPDKSVRDELLSSFPIPKDDVGFLTNMREAAVRTREFLFGCDRIWSLYSSTYSLAHMFAEVGIKGLWYEATGQEYARWQVAAAYLRGAARQFSLPYGWYVAHFLTQYDRKQSKCRLGHNYWTGDLTPSYQTTQCGPWYGIGETLLARQNAYGWLIGSSFLQVEDWIRLYRDMDPAPGGRYRPHKAARDFESLYELSKIVDRGVHYTPCAILAPMLERHNAAGLKANECRLSLNSFFLTLVPIGSDLMQREIKNAGNQGCFFNTPYGEFCDVLVPDSSQPAETFAEALSAYKVAILAGDDYIKDRFNAAAVEKYVERGGTLVVSWDRIADGLVPSRISGVDFAPGAQVSPAGSVLFIRDGSKSQRFAELGEGFAWAKPISCARAKPFIFDEKGTVAGWVNTFGKGRVITIAAHRFLKDDARTDAGRIGAAFVTQGFAGKRTFPLVAALLKFVRDETMPVTVEGDCQWGVNRTKKGWTVWMFNNKGVCKFFGEKETYDAKKTAKVRISLRERNICQTLELAPGEWKIKEFDLAERPVEIDYGHRGFNLATGLEKPTSGTVGEGRTDKSRVFVVDAAAYVSAKVVCSVDPDPGLFPTFTVRLTRYNDGGAMTGRAYQGMADARVDLRTAQKRDLGGGKWEVTVPLDCGDLIGIIRKDAWGTFLNDKMPESGRRATMIGNYLDFEILGETPTFRHPLGDRRSSPDPKRPSAVTVYSASLEKAGAELLPEQICPGNVFNNGEKPQTKVRLSVMRPGSYRFEWLIRDVEGRKVGGASEAFSSDRTVTLDLTAPSLGWYALEMSVLEGDRRLMKHHGSFALLGEDTRTSGVGEGPYGTWSYGGAHYTSRDLDFIGPLLCKAGFRRAQGIEDCGDVAERHKWKLSPPSVMRWREFCASSDEKRMKVISQSLKNDPNVKMFLIGHESAPNSSYQQAWEISGQRLDPACGLNGWYASEAVVKNPSPKLRIAPEDRKRIIAQAKYAGEFIRKNFPQLEVTVGNSLGCSEFVAELIRAGFKEEWADYMGLETVARSNLPERQWESSLQAADFMEQTAKHFGYGKWKVNACWESNYRLPDLIGEDRQAQWYVRDILVSQCRRFPDIFVGVLMDTGNKYTRSFWGASGLCGPRPYCYPRKSYVGIATATKLLDMVESAKAIETGDPCVYAWEFRRRDGKYVTALWTSRGEVDLALETLAPFKAIDFYGRDISNYVRAGEWASYLVSQKPCLRSVTVAARRFPGDSQPADAKLLVKANDAAEWKINPGIEENIERTKGPHMPFRTRGKYKIRTVDDEEKGPSVELELDEPNMELPLVIGEYVVVELKKPIEIPAQARTLGAWVKGNSGWGQFYWVIALPDGRRALSSGWMGKAPDAFDHEGLRSIDYSGWCYLSIPLNDESPIKNISTGNVPGYWMGGSLPMGNKKPFKLLGVAFSCQNRPLLLTERRPWPQKIRFASVFASDFTEQ